MTTMSLLLSRKLYLHLDQVTIYPHGSDEDDNPIEKDSFSCYVAYICDTDKDCPDMLDEAIKDKYLANYPNMSYGIYSDGTVEAIENAIVFQMYPDTY